jgi:hypothetical protein
VQPPGGARPGLRARLRTGAEAEEHAGLTIFLNRTLTKSGTFSLSSIKRTHVIVQGAFHVLELRAFRIILYFIYKSIKVSRQV